MINTQQQTYLRSVRNSVKFSFYLFLKLPAAWFMGLRVRHLDLKSCQVALPYGWRSKNPFRSIYFAAQTAAGELSTGLLCQAHLQGRVPVSMLVTKVEAQFFKKASDTLTFTCTDGTVVEQLIEAAIADGLPHELTMHSQGCLPNGEVASKISITWSFKLKNRV